MDTKIIQVTPVMAQKWLSLHNSKNRPIYESTVAAYAADMKRGCWALNNQGIGFDENGELIDGQHRLQAIVNSGATVPILVIRGLPINFFDGHSTQETIDRGKIRTIGDVLRLSHGIENGNLQSAIAAVLATLCVSTVKKMTASSTWEILKLYNNEIDLVLEKRKNVPRLIYAPALGAFVFAAKVFKEKTIEFEEKYFSGEELKAKDPILTFRNFMLNRVNTGGLGSTYRKIVWNHALTCLMYHNNGELLKRLVQSNAGYEYFANKQRRTINQVVELFNY